MRITKSLVIDTIINAAGLLAFGAYLNYKTQKELAEIERNNKQKIQEAFWKGHEAGWFGAGKSYFSVKENYVKMFGNVKPYPVQK